MMHFSTVLIALVALVLVGLAKADDLVSPARIKVFLYGAASFYSEVVVDVRNSTCLSLDNNMIDGTVNSVLVGGYDVWTVLARDDQWYCVFYDNYLCNGTEDTMLTVPDGANNLASSGWGSRIHGIQCINQD